MAPATSPDWEPVMKIAGGIVTDSGGRTCHAAIVARELGIPAVVGAAHATETAEDRDQWSRSPAPRATSGMSIAGSVAFDVARTPVERIHGAAHADHGQSRQSRTGLPDRDACRKAGVGLARMEFIISEHIGVHPMALLKPEQGHIGQGAGRDRAPDARLQESRPIFSSRSCPKASAPSPRRSIRSR